MPQSLLRPAQLHPAYRQILSHQPQPMDPPSLGTLKMSALSSLHLQGRCLYFLTVHIFAALHGNCVIPSFSSSAGRVDNYHPLGSPGLSHPPVNPGGLHASRVLGPVFSTCPETVRLTFPWVDTKTSVSPRVSQMLSSTSPVWSCQSLWFWCNCEGEVVCSGGKKGSDSLLNILKGGHLWCLTSLWITQMK